MAIFSQNGIQFLSDLRSQISALKTSYEKEKKDSSSSKTHKMLNAAYNIINAFIEHNEISYWRADEHQNWLIKQFFAISEKPKQYVPNVFNSMTRQLAEIILKALKNFKMGEHFKIYVEGAIKVFVGDMDDILKESRNHLTLNLKCHEIILAQNNVEVLAYETEYNLLVSEMHTRVSSFKTTISPDELKKQQSAMVQFYRKKVEALLSLLSKISYLSIMDIPADGDEPLTLHKINLCENRLTRIRTFLQLESDINETQEKNHSEFRLTDIHDHFKKICTREKCQEQESKLKHCIHQAKKDLAVFKPSEKPSFFQKSDYFFERIFDAKIMDEKQTSCSVLCEHFFKTMSETAAQMRHTVTESVRKTKEILNEKHMKDLWKCAILLEKHALEFLVICLTLNESNDFSVFYALTKNTQSKEIQHLNQLNKVSSPKLS